MSSSLTRVTGRAPALAAGLLVLAAAMPATAYAAASAPESPRTPASAVHEPAAAGAPAENAPKDTPEAAAAAAPAEAAEASDASAATEAAAADASAPTTPEAAAAEAAETESAESSGSGYWDSLGATGSESAEAEAESTESTEDAETDSWQRPERPGTEAPGAPGTETPKPAPPAPPSTAPSPIEGRTEGGSIILTNGDVVACAAVGDLRIHGTDGREYQTNGPGTRFTTTAGTEVVTIATGHVRVTVGGASAEITCGAEGFPTVVGLPQTGASSDLAMLSLAGFGLVAAGGAVVVASRRTRRLRAE